MSRTLGHRKPRIRLCKFADHYTGWYGEDNRSPEARRFIKRLVRRRNRRFLSREEEV